MAASPLLRIAWLTMPIELKPFEYSADAHKEISGLESMDWAQRNRKLAELTQGGASNNLHLLGAFYFLVHDLVDKRKQGSEEGQINLASAVTEGIMKSMKEESCFFGYGSGQEFFMQLDPVKPPVFHKDCEILHNITEVFLDKPKQAGPVLPETFDEDMQGKLKHICNQTEESYQEAMESLIVMKESRRLKERFAKGDKSVTMDQVREAKPKFEAASQKYVAATKVIAQGMPLIYQSYQQYQKELVLRKIYAKFLAKLLASREAKFPVENYVLRLAQGEFDWSPVEIVISEEEENRGMTMDTKTAEVLKALQLPINRLESRYRKRKLMTQLAQGTPVHEVIKDLNALHDLDPDDIKTDILLARMIADYSKTQGNAQKRVTLREKALGYCQSAFANIDTYLDLQGIEDVRERDRIRVGFVKTISQIRLPLVRGK